MIRNSLFSELIQFENSFDVCKFHFKYDNILFWPFVRSYLFPKLIVQKENIPPIYKKKYSFLFNLLKYIYSIILYSPLRNLRQSDILIFGSHEGLIQINGKWFNRWTDYFYLEYIKSTMIIEDSSSYVIKNKRFCSNFRLHDWLKIKASIRTKLNHTVSPVDRNSINEFITFLQNNFPLELSKNDYEHIDKYLSSLSSLLPNLYHYYNKLLAKTNPKIVFVECACYGKNCIIVKWAKDMGIKTGEFQHGHFSINDSPYNYGLNISKNKEYSKYVPEFLLTFGQFANENSFGSFKKINIGHPHLEMKSKKLKGSVGVNKSSINVFIIISRIELIIDLIINFSKKVENENISIITRPHPSYDVPIDLKDRLLSCKNVYIDSSDDAYEQIYHSDYIIGTISTLLFEASFFSKPVFIYENKESRLIMPEDFGIWFKNADDLKLLIDNPSLMKSSGNYNYWVNDWKQRYRDFITGIS